MEKRIVLIGNCQVMAVCWYLNRLPQENKIRAKWLNFNYWNIDEVAWPKNASTFEDQLRSNVYGLSDSKEAIETADTVIYQPHYSALQRIKETKARLEEITLPPVILDQPNFVKRKEDKYKTTIILSDLIEKYPIEKLMVKQANHLSVFFNLEIIRRICFVCGFRYFSNETLNYLKGYQYPKF